MLTLAVGDIHPPEASGRHRAGWDTVVRTLRDGGVALLPTDTVYGLHARWDVPLARHRILALKARPSGTPLLCLLGSLDMLDLPAPVVPRRGWELMQRHWPGPITFVIPAGPAAPPALVKDGGIAVRWPKDPFVTDLVTAVGAPLVSTSANPSGSPPVVSADRIPTSWAGRLDLVIDGGQLAGSSSTVVRVSKSGAVTVVREGPVKIDA